jgi:phosphate transport system substrate-binding protein
MTEFFKNPDFILTSNTRSNTRLRTPSETRIGTFSKILSFREKALIAFIFAALSALILVGPALAKSKDNEIKEEYLSHFPFLQDSGVPKLNEAPTFSLREEKKWNIPRLDGSTSLLPLYGTFVENVYPTPNALRSDNDKAADNYLYVEEVVDVSKTALAFERLLAGEVDVYFTPVYSQGMKDEADKRGLKLKVKRIAREAFVFLVNDSNPTSDISSKNLRDVYSGKIKNWSQIGGENAEILAYQRNKDSGSQIYFNKFMGSQKPMTPIENTELRGMGMVITTVADYTNGANALGYSYRFFVVNMVGEKGIKLLKVDGVEPSDDNIKSGKYPLTTSIYAISVEKDPASETPRDENARKLVDWILSPQGQSLTKEVGYVPVSG